MENNILNKKYFKEKKITIKRLQSIEFLDSIH